MRRSVADLTAGAFLVPAWCGDRFSMCQTANWSTRSAREGLSAFRHTGVQTSAAWAAGFAGCATAGESLVFDGYSGLSGFGLSRSGSSKSRKSAAKRSGTPSLTMSE